MSQFKESILTVPADLVRSCLGLAIDFGSSAVKCVFRTKEDFDGVESPDETVGNLHLASFTRDELNSGFDYVLQRAFIQNGANSNGPSTFFTTGVGSTQLGLFLAEKLNVKLEVIGECDCIANSIHYLANRLPRHLLLEPINEVALAEALGIVKSSQPIMNGASHSEKFIPSWLPEDLAHIESNLLQANGRPLGTVSDEATANVPLSEAESDTFPCFVVCCGSCIFFQRIEKDGKFKVVQFNPSGGRMMLGAGNLIAGCKTYDELMELASNGDSRQTDQFFHELLASSQSVEGDDSLYTLMADLKPVQVFQFGKLVGANVADFRREDIARAWLECTLQELSLAVNLACSLHNIRRVFFTGGMCTHPLARHILTAKMAYTNYQQQLEAKTPPIFFDFIKSGQHFGAIGCSIEGILHSTN